MKREPRASAILIAVLATIALSSGCGGGGGGGSGPPGSGGGALTPAPPNANDFMWQSLQIEFNASTCTGAVTLAVAPDAVCYVDSNSQLKCAGRIYTKTYGSSFVAAGQTGVDQILLSATFNSATGNAICVHEVTATGGTVWCFGDANSWGQFGGGVSGPSANWVQWGGPNASKLTRIATGTWDQICALDSNGTVSCSGAGFGTSPVVQGTGSGHRSVWVDTFGNVHIDDPAVFRASAGRAVCKVRTGGLDCEDVPGVYYGTAGSVVDGNEVMMPPSAGFSVCWLDSSGRLFCKDGSQHFSTVTVLAFGSSPYTNTLCAAGSDGSLWCVGDNSQGKLGNGNTSALSTDTQVQPPGSLRISCP